MNKNFFYLNNLDAHHDEHCFVATKQKLSGQLIENKNVLKKTFWTFLIFLKFNFKNLKNFAKLCSKNFFVQLLNKSY